MANVNQIYSIVNDSANEALGTKAITVKDTASFVSLGQEILSSETSTDMFYKALVDRIGKTIFAIRAYNGMERSVKREEMEFGIILQKISFGLATATENPTWETNTQQSPYDIKGTIKPKQKLFSKVGTWSYEEKIPQIQLFTAFTDVYAMGQFISSIYVALENSLKLDFDNLSNLAVNTYMAGVLASTSTVCKRNVLAEFNTGRTTPLLAANALTDTEFLKYTSKEISVTVDNMERLTKVFNVEGFPRHTPKDKVVVEVLNQFAKASQYYLQADTYHNDLVALPRYETIPYWQATQNFDFNSTSTIAVKNGNIEVTQSGIIAFVHDYDAVASSIYKRRDYSAFNPRSEVLNVMQKATKGYVADLSENGVVFYIADTPNSTSLKTK